MKWQVITGDCVEIMADMAEASVDAIVTDPPYGLHFMGKTWDRFGGPTGKDNTTHSERGGAMHAGKYDLRLAGQQGFQAEAYTWGVEMIRVLKPGGHVLIFGGTRTYHRLTCALEDAGFEIRDCLAWLYGSGFPKSLDVSKAIDRAAGADREVVGEKALTKLNPYAFEEGHAGTVPVTAPATIDAITWGGWGTALKPAFEPIVLARKPLNGTVAANVLTWNVGALNIDGCRIGGQEDTDAANDGGSDQSTAREGAGRSDVPGVRQDVRHGEVQPERPVQHRMSDVAADRRAESQLHDGELHPDANRLPDAEGRTQHLSPGASRSDGGTSGASTPALGARSSRQRSQDGQPTGEPRDSGSSGALTDAPGSVGRASEPAIGEPAPAAALSGGRWPANVILDESAAEMLDEQSGERPGATSFSRPKDYSASSYRVGDSDLQPGYADTGGASRFFYTPKADRAERNRGLEHRVAAYSPDDGYGSIQTPNLDRSTPRENWTPHKAQNNHPTVKPVALMQWLCRLITPPNGTVLDPFTGSGTTGIAALREGFSFIGIEREPEYVEIARDRIIGDAPLWNVDAEVK